MDIITVQHIINILEKTKILSLFKTIYCKEIQWETEGG